MKGRLLIGGFLGILVATNIFFFLALQRELRHNNPSKEFPLLSSRLFASHTNDVIIDFEPLRSQIRQYFDKQNLNHSFYFEYLPSGVNIRNGDSNELIAASLMKTPLVMNLYKAVEQNEVVIDREYPLLAEDINSDTVYGNTSGLVASQTLSLRDAAKLTLSSSDNTAAHFISRQITPVVNDQDNAINYLDLEISKQNTDNGTYATIGARSYSSILKCLYLSCFLQQNDSQEILSYMTNSKDRSRIAAGIPPTIKVASKIGSFSDQSQSDCGIVYEPNRPFLICAMLFTGDQNADHYFSDLAKLCYDYVHGYQQSGN